MEQLTVVELMLKDLMVAFPILFILLLFNLLVVVREEILMQAPEEQVDLVEVVRFQIRLVEQEILHQ